MSKAVYWTANDDIGAQVFAAGAQGNPYRFEVNGAKIIGKYEGDPPCWKQTLLDSTTQIPIVKRTENDGVEDWEIEWIYNSSAGGWCVYRDRPAMGAWTERMYHTSIGSDSEFKDNRLMNGTTYTSYDSLTPSEILDVTSAGTSDGSAGSSGSDGASFPEVESSEGYHPDIQSITTFTHVWDRETQGEEYFSVANILGVFGIPYQFMPHVDPRLRYKQNDQIVAGTSSYLTDTQGTGLEYADHIASVMPVLFLAPGLPNFMTKFSKEDKQTISDFIAQSIAGIANALTPDELVKESGKYYTFEYAVSQYYQYVNPMCRIASAYLGVNHYTFDGVRMDNLNWMDYTMTKLTGIFQGKTDITDYVSVPFYIESETQISESFSNDVTESSIMSSIDSISDIGREAMFVLGYAQSALLGNSLINVNGGDANATMNSFMNTWGSIAGNNSFLQKLLSNVASVATGGRLVFPKIWSDSSFSRSYNVTIKLRSPDMDNLSIYLNVIVPFLHLVGLAWPRQLDANPNGYASPFLVRAIYKGFFNIDMGIITSMSVTKGDQAQWNLNGIPTAIDVSLSIADLYDNISMTPTTTTNWTYDTMDNTCQMDYLATMCGINIYQPEVGRTLRMWLVNNFTNRARDFIDISVWGNIKNSIANAITNVWRGKTL